MNLKIFFSVLSLFAGVTLSEAAVSLPAWVSDNMIVQQNSNMTIKGKSNPGSEIIFSSTWLDNPLKTGANAQGEFSFEIPTPPAGGPYSMSFKDSEGTVNIENVLSGEVWLCSGQSNMEMPVHGWGNVMDYDHEIATANYPDIRLLQVKKKTALQPMDDVVVNNGGWQICSPGSMADFSAIAYFFAKELSEKLRIPIGVIDTTWGGTPAEAWTSQEALANVAGFENELNDLKEAGYDLNTLNDLYQRRTNDWFENVSRATKNFDKAQLQTDSSWKKLNIPGYWEHAGLPDFDGIVWLQKEIELPDSFQGKNLSLKFAAIDDDDETYFNGTLVGKVSGASVPRNYSVPADIVKKGKNVITIKVLDYGGLGGINSGNAELIGDGQSLSLAGEWQYLPDKDFSTIAPKPVSPESSNYPSVLYNAMLSPLKDMPVKGVLWYQGCANVGRDEQYEPLFQTLIKDWRNLWGENLPFYFVQLAGFLQPKAVQPESQWAALREAQAKALSLPNTAMATAIDLGNPVDIHPKNKQEVAHRLALIALGRDYGYDEVYSSPIVQSCKYDKDGVVIQFNEEILPSTNAVTGFIIAGDDGVFTTATPVKIDEKSIKVSSKKVKNPKSIRYNWADFPGGNLYGKTGLPVTPFAHDK